MKKPETGGLDSAAAYVALSRATCLEKLFLIEPVVLADLQHKPSNETLAALDFLNRLGSSTEAAFFEHPPTFRPVAVRSTPDRHFFANLRTASQPLDYPSPWNGHGIEDEDALYKEIMDAEQDLWETENDIPVTAEQHARLLQEMDAQEAMWRREDDPHGIEDEDALYAELMDVSDGDKNSAPTIFLMPNERNNCFHNAAVASMIACFEGCFLPTTSCTPAASSFFRTVQTVRTNMGQVLSGGILVRLFLLRF